VKPVDLYITKQFKKELKIRNKLIKSNLGLLNQIHNIEEAFQRLQDAQRVIFESPRFFKVKVSKQEIRSIRAYIRREIKDLKRNIKKCKLSKNAKKD